MPPYVMAADRDFVSVKATHWVLQQALLEFGFLPASLDKADEFIKRTKDEPEKAIIFEFLRPLGVHCHCLDLTRHLGDQEE